MFRKKENSCTFQGLWAIFKHFSRQICEPCIKSILCYEEEGLVSYEQGGS